MTFDDFTNLKPGDVLEIGEEHYTCTRMNDLTHGTFIDSKKKTHVISWSANRVFIQGNGSTGHDPKQTKIKTA